MVTTRRGTPVARLVPVRPPVPRRAGDWVALPAWRDYGFNAADFAPLDEAERRVEGWE